MCRAIGDEGRLRLYRRIAAAGADGVEATEIDDADGLALLVEAGLVTLLPLAVRRRYRAEPDRLGRALRRLPARRSGPH